MKEVHININARIIPTFAEFVQEFPLKETDLLFTQKFLYEDYMKALNLPCQFLFYDDYETGEPTDDMIDMLYAKLKDMNFDRIIGVGGGSVMDSAKMLSYVNVEHIIATLLDEKRLGGFHFNNHRYADDDLILGTVNPLDIFSIYKEIVDADIDGLPTNITYMLDQSHNIENSIEGIIYSIMNIQTAYAKSLIIDRKALKASQAEYDTLLSNKIVMEAFETDVQPLIQTVRLEMGLSHVDPLENYRSSGYQKKIAGAREDGALTLGGGC